MRIWRGLSILVGVIIVVLAGVVLFGRRDAARLYWLMTPISSNISDNTILRLNADGSEVTEFPHQIEQFWTAVWSPNGQYVAYISGIFYDLYTTRYDGTELTQIFGCFGPIQSPTWSPDSGQIAFVANCRQQTLSLFVMDFDQEDIRSTCVQDVEVSHIIDDDGQVITYEQQVARYEGGEIYRLTDNNGIENTPQWSPDGEWITFQSQRDGKTNIYVIRPDGSDIRLLTDERTAWRPVWSPDSQWIAYQTIHDLSNLAIKRIHIESGNVQIVTTLQSQNPPANYWSPWSPDGRWLVFTSTRDNNQEIYKIRADGSQLTRLTDNPRYDGQPIWSPDGEWIAFLSVRDSAFEVYRIRPDGSDVQRLTENASIEQLPMWSPLIDKPSRFELLLGFGIAFVMFPVGVQYLLRRIGLLTELTI